jgi:hypothetical protein
MFFGLFTRGERQALRRLQLRQERLALQLAELSTKVETTSGAALLVQINDVASALESLARSNRREFGRLWKRTPGETNAIAVPAEQPVDAPACENWVAAQSAGPTSQAAQCDCAYCLRKRAERGQLRAALVPKGPRTIDRGKH